MARHLLDIYIEPILKRGSGIAQFLGGFDFEGQQAIRYITINRRTDGYVLSVDEMLDDGASYPRQEPQFFDPGEFTPINEEPQEFTFKSLEETLEFASSQFGADPTRYVNESMLGDEYADYAKHRNA